MGAVGVVVVDVVDDESFELVLVPDDGAVEELAAQGPDPAFGEALATGVRTGVLRILRPSVRKISSKVSMNWLPAIVLSRARAFGESIWMMEEFRSGLLACPGVY